MTATAKEKFDGWMARHPGAGKTLAAAKATSEQAFHALFEDYWSASQAGRDMPALRAATNSPATASSWDKHIAAVNSRVMASDVYQRRAAERRARVAAVPALNE